MFEGMGTEYGEGRCIAPVSFRTVITAAMRKEVRIALRHVLSQYKTNMMNEMQKSII